MPLFSLTKFLIWTAFAAALTFVLVVRFSPLALALFALVAATTVYWLVRHRLELGRRYLKAEEKAAIPGLYDKLLGRSKPRPKDIAPWGCAPWRDVLLLRRRNRPWQRTHSLGARRLRHIGHGRRGWLLCHRGHHTPSRWLRVVAREQEHPVRPNPSIKRTRNGLPLRVAQLKR